jgi:hypothetical protein
LLQIHDHFKLNTATSAPVAWQPRAAGVSVAAASGKTSGGRGMGTATSSTDLATASSTGLTVGGWGAEDTDEDRSEVVQVTCDLQLHFLADLDAET